MTIDRSSIVGLVWFDCVAERSWRVGGIEGGIEGGVEEGVKWTERDKVCVCVRQTDRQTERGWRG